ncbi:TPA: H-NS histone family protein [Escherichia coli]|uniref:H-NS histone family protein n=1 Tax=Escherichia coli TaxID=562 RepID=UPI00169B5CED|nr:H-NS family nucleoid-associated regulatory protein [Escherichia coli]EFA5469712.1 DNA-binding protein [Escherichia coli]EFJ2736734.1 H-NS histone family protein [Escherichia coli]EFK4235041.1 H-NS histone family protein [Escherichia coli]EJT1357477.1 H-NS histone family protein [Escherichia coli]EKS1144778.1 H-NS histone family protein [Escherichia coli]
MCKLTKEEEYSIISRTMTNIRSLRMYVRGVDFEQLLDMQEKLNAVIEERRKDAEREAAERAEREEKRQELLQLIAEEGFSPEELLDRPEDTPKSRKKTLPKAPPKYQFEENGETKYWSGRGRAPKPIDEAMKAGRSLEDFRINKNSNDITDEQ